MDEGLVYVGKIMALEPIEKADKIMSATVVCGKGGKWKGVVRKNEFNLEDICLVYLPDAIVPESEEMRFLESSNWRVRMRRFRGAPSEVVIVPYKGEGVIGTDLTKEKGVTKYHKPVPASLAGQIEGEFPGFIPKTDEPNYQSAQDLVEVLHGKHYYITEKADGSSTTAFRYKGKFGVCSRNWEMKRNESNGYWKVALKYKLEERLREGYAIQWETCGPKIQSNPMQLKEIDGFMFSAYKIDEKRYFDYGELATLSIELGFPMVEILDAGWRFNRDSVSELGTGSYKNGRAREGVVVRSQALFDGKPISFKVINLDYETKKAA